METPPNPIDKTGEEAKRLGLPVPPRPTIQRYDPIVFFDQGGSALGEIEKRNDGDYVLFEDYVETAAEIAHLREVNAELLAALEQLIFAHENADETGYVADVGFLGIDAVQQQARAAIAKANT